MKQQYIRQVKKALNLPREQKAEVLRDLDEAFASALEHGETERQVIERLGGEISIYDTLDLGTPDEFADSIHEQLGIACPDRRGRKRRICIALTAIVSAIAFAIAFFMRAERPAQNIIGQADAMTNMQIVGSGVDMFWLMIALGCIALAAAIGLMANHIKAAGKETA